MLQFRKCIAVSSSTAQHVEGIVVRIKNFLSKAEFLSFEEKKFSKLFKSKAELLNFDKSSQNCPRLHSDVKQLLAINTFDLLCLFWLCLEILIKVLGKLVMQ